MIRYRLTKPGKLTRAEWNLWDRWQQEQPALESPYFRPEFTQAVAAVRDDVEIAVLEHSSTPVGFFPFQRGAFNLGRPIGGKLNDFHGPITHPDLDFNVSDLIAGCRLSAWDFDHLVDPQGRFGKHVSDVDASPYIDLTAGFAAYCEQRKQAGSEVIRKTISRGRKFQNEVGPLRFEWNSRHEQVLPHLIRWKVEQFQRTGFMNLFAFEWTETLLRRIHGQHTPGLSAQISVLWNGETPLAIAYSLRSFHVAHAWFVAYDPTYATYSPGMILFLKMAEEGARQGVQRLHLGAGDQRFKQSLASGSVSVAVGTIESKSLGTAVRHAWRSTREWVANTAWLHSLLQKPAALLRPVRSWMAFR
jgi:CelD/BcsL family acetyltransferase involved in cellulose biosynthesis